MKEKSGFYSSLRLLLVLNLLVKPLWIFWIDRTVQNQQGAVLYGTYFSLYGFVVVFSFLADWGLTTYMNRQLAADPDYYFKRTGNFLLLKIILVLLYIVIAGLLAVLSGIHAWEMLFLLLAIQVLNAFFFFNRAIITAKQWFGPDAWFSVLDKAMMLLFCGSFLLLPVLGQLSLPVFLWIQLISTGTAFLATAVFLRIRRTGFHFYKEPGFYMQLLKQAWPYGLIVLLMSAHNRIDAFLLERIHPNGSWEAGIYAGAYRLVDAGNMAGYLLASFLLPFIARHRQQTGMIHEALLTSRHLLLLFSVGTAVMAIALAPMIQSVLYYNREPHAIEVMQYCIPVLIAYGIIQLYGTLLTATGHIRLFCLISGVALLLNILLNLYLIPRYGALGCCFAALISQSLAALFTLQLAIKKTGAGQDARSFAGYIFTGAILFCFLYFGKQYIHNFWLLAVAGTLLSVLAAIALKLINLKRLSLFIKPD